MGVRFLNTNQAHLQEAEQEQRAQRPQRATRASGIPARIEDHLVRFKASLQKAQEALHVVTQIFN
jgi:hypothetical protein